MRRLAFLVALISVTALPGCRGVRHAGQPDTTELPHLESAALVCQADDELPTIALARGEAGRTCEQAWEDLSRITDELLLFRCEPVCGNGRLLVDGQDYSPVFAGERLERSSYLSFGLLTEAGDQVQAYLAVVAEEPAAAQDSYLRTLELAQELDRNDRILEPSTVPSVVAAAHPRPAVQAGRSLAPSE